MAQAQLRCNRPAAKPRRMVITGLELTAKRPAKPDISEGRSAESGAPADGLALLAQAIASLGSRDRAKLAAMLKGAIEVGFGRRGLPVNARRRDEPSDTDSLTWWSPALGHASVDVTMLYAHINRAKAASSQRSAAVQCSMHANEQARVNSNTCAVSTWVCILLHCNLQAETWRPALHSWWVCPAREARNSPRMTAAATAS